VACLPVSVILAPPWDSAFGAIAESIIGSRFLDHIGRTGRGFFPSSTTQEDFQDISIGIGNSRLYLLYLGFHNTISFKQMLILTASAMVKIPDLITHNPSNPRKTIHPTRTEFYEIKPNSPTGIADGLGKIVAISLLYSALPLPYLSGTMWSPDERILISSGSPLGVRLEVFFHFKRISPGLIVYDICIEGELEKIALAVLIAILAIILAIIFGGKRLPVPMPNPGLLR
jgi:hypothetical protein